MAWLQSDSIALAALLVTAFFALLNYLYTRKRTQLQPRIYISKARIVNPYIVRENKPPCCTFKILFRNSGDISTVIDFQTGLNIRPYYLERKKNVVSTLIRPLKEGELFLDPGENKIETFTFNLIEEVEDWEEGTLSIFGTYLGYQDKERYISILFEGKRDDKRWSPLIYFIDEDTLLGFIKRGIRLFRGWYRLRKWKKKVGYRLHK